MEIKNQNGGMDDFFKLEFDDLNVDPDYHE